jgi:serine/threonine-protein kinase RsbW
MALEQHIGLGAQRMPFDQCRQAVVDEVAPLRRALTRWAKGAGASERTCEAVAIASSEAITNAVVHAYRDASAPGMVSVRGEIVVAPDRVHVEISDTGAGMRPRTDSPGLGLGLPLIAQLADRVEVDSRLAEGTCITMDFSLLSG